MSAVLLAHSNISSSDFEPAITTFPVEKIKQTGPCEVLKIAPRNWSGS